MARARNIKPGTMENEKLAECEPLARLLFIYLWMLADRSGRLEDRPKRIAIQALPYDRDADVDALLNDLELSGFIKRYQVDDEAYIQILKFEQHQSPHGKEKASTIPAPDKVGTSSGQSPDKHQTSTSTARPDSHDSHDSGHSSSYEEESPPSDDPPADASKKNNGKTPPCPHQRIVEAYHAELPQLPAVAKLTEKRLKWLRARWRESEQHQTVEFWRAFFAHVRESEFLTGNNDRGWTADFEWLVNSSNFYKTIEGKYHHAA